MFFEKLAGWIPESWYSENKGREKQNSCNGRDRESRPYCFEVGTVPAKKRMTRKGKAPKVTKTGKTAEDLQSVRNTVTKLIVDSSEQMVQRVVQSVSEAGSVAGSVSALRYLWELVGLFPATVEAPGGEDALAKSLLRGLGLPEELPQSEAELEGDVKSESTE